MSSATRVPETASMRHPELTLEDAWVTLRRHGGLRLLKEAFARFRYGDGFSHSRALGLQLALAAVPLVIAFVGLSRTLNTASLGDVLQHTLLSLAPGGSGQLFRNTLTRPTLIGEDRDELALWLGLLFAVTTLTTAMGQLERGANRIYGVQRDRPSARKYGHALLMAVIAGIPAMIGVVLLLAVNAFADAVEAQYGIDDDVVSAVGLPLGVVLIVGALTVMLKSSPRRQPGLSWLAVGALIAVTLWLLFTVLFASYLQISNNFSVVYGPLTGIMALLLWGQFTAMAVLFGLAFAAQLEAFRAGVRHGATDDPEHPRDSGHRSS